MPALRELARTDALETAAALVGRFYGDGLEWALALPLPALIRRQRLMSHVARIERGG